MAAQPYYGEGRNDPAPGQPPRRPLARLAYDFWGFLNTAPAAPRVPDGPPLTVFHGPPLPGSRVEDDNEGSPSANRNDSHETRQRIKRRRLGLEREGEWRGVALLGDGGQGTAMLFVRKNYSGHTLDRMVVKDCQLYPSEWRDPLTWKSGVPREVVIHSKLHALGSRYIIGYRGYRVMPQRRRYRIYTDFAAHKTLEDLIEKYLEPNGPNSPMHIPVEFLWYVFQALVVACFNMRQGILPNGEQGVTPWDEVVQRDLKPNNIFLAAPNEDYFKVYPEPKMGDFGFAIETNERDPQNPHFYTEQATPGFFAPEQYDWEPRDLTASGQGRLNHATNVYQIGAIMASLIQRTTDSHPLNGPLVEGPNHQFPLRWLHEPDNRDNPDDQNVLFARIVHGLLRVLPGYRREDPPHIPHPGFTEPRQGFAAEFLELKRLVRGCLRHDASQRFSLRYLHHQIDRHIHTGLPGKVSPAPDWVPQDLGRRSTRNWVSNRDVVFEGKLYFAEDEYPLLRNRNR